MAGFLDARTRERLSYVTRGGAERATLQERIVDLARAAGASSAL